MSSEIPGYQAMEKRHVVIDLPTKKAPDTEEKMTLAKLGLGLKELSFEMDGDSLHIHSVILGNWRSMVATV